MTLLAMEGFEGGGTTNGSGASAAVRDYMKSRYRTELQTSGNGVIRVENGIGFGKALSFGGDTNADLNYFDVPLNKLVTECFVGFWFKPGKTLRTGSIPICRWRQSAYDENQVELRIVENSSIVFFTDDFTQLPDTIVPNVFKPDVWTHIEIRIVVSPTTGIVQIRKNGTEVLNATSQDTQGNSGGDSIDVIRFTGGESASNTLVSEQWLIDDIVILDTTGASNTTFLGPLKVEGIFPTTEGATINFTPLSGTNNALMVDDNAKDDDTTYNSSTDTASNKDLLAAPDLTDITGNIRGVQITNQAKTTQPGPIGMQSIVAEGTPTQGTGSIMEIIDPHLYTRFWHVFELNPDTSALWSVAEVNGMEFGYEID